MKCQQPGCTGTIVDGYCDVCGMAPADGTAVSSASPGLVTGASAPSSTNDGSKCRQPGCTGTIVDGYCDVCGTPAGAAPVVETPVSEGAGSQTGSFRLESAAIGSQRAAGSGATHRIRTGSQRLRSARLGAGLTTIPPVPLVDASKVIMKNPEVAEDKRTCAKCGGPVGRSKDGRPGRSEGFCPSCGQAFSFTPKLKAGDLVAGQYEVAGCLAHGGLGWIYLARDKNVSDRWVVLKGLLNSGDADALAAAIAEQRFLAQVEHPLIVEIYNFVTHDNAGYIVMEYVGGTSLKQLLKERMRANGGTYDPLPVDQALAFILEILPAFQYLHDLGLIYCDFKPDNLIQVGDALKLIDLGGVRHVDDQDSAIYGTVGYQAPEVATAGPSVASDIYTIGRTLVVLCMEFKGYQSTYLSSLPDPESTPLFQEHDSLYALVSKCCATDPADRFQSADELRVQMLGVLREVVAEKRAGTALTSAASQLFETPAVTTVRLDWSQLPALRADTSDSQYAFLSALAPATASRRLEQLEKVPEESAEVRLWRARAALEAEKPDLAVRESGLLLQADPWEWRALWVSGLAALQQEKWDDAASSFNAVYHQVPGELAPKLALALACENGGRREVAEGFYTTCAETDAAYVAPSAFGVARIRAATGDTDGAVQALDLVPPTSRGYGESRELRAEVLLRGAGDDLMRLSAAMSSVEGASLEPYQRAKLTTKILGKALEVVTRKGPGTVRIGSYEAKEPSLRNGLEASYRVLAREAQDRDTQVLMVGRANAVRNWTLT
ncbi:serine/threonine-protein kinase [Nocardioides islandensis]|nr:tetratricopeptide repeat protein [Nocardioides islandensis]